MVRSYRPDPPSNSDLDIPSQTTSATDDWTVRRWLGANKVNEEGDEASKTTPSGAAAAACLRESERRKRAGWA